MSGIFKDGPTDGQITDTSDYIGPLLINRKSRQTYNGPRPAKFVRAIFQSIIAQMDKDLRNYKNGDFDPIFARTIRK